jgi:hypothetical protein
MKRTLTILAVIALFSFAAVKKYQLEEGQAIMMFNYIEETKKALPYSEVISAKKASELIATGDSLQKVIYKQYSDTTTKK